MFTFFNKYVYPPSYMIDALLLNGGLYNRLLIIKFASYKCRLKNKAVLILSKR